MKKTTLAGLAMLMLATTGTPAMAQDAVYDFSGFTDSGLLELFYNALKQGRKYPTKAEFEAAGIQESDLAFVRSHVRRANIMSREDRLVPSTTQERDLWMNIPMDVGSGGDAGYPGTKFAADVFSMWQYTNLFGSWNHSIFQAPGCWVDAAHRNGTDIFSGIKFFESWTAGSGDKAYSALITQKNSDGTYKYVEPMINCLMFFGSDGVNYNWEDNSYFTNTNIAAFHKALYKKAEEQGFTNFHAGIYTANSSLTPAYANALFGNSEGRTFELMLNYSSGDFTTASAMTNSVKAAKAAMGTAEGLYTGVWISSMDRSWTNLNNSKEINVCLWGEHGQSRFMSYNSGSDAYDTQGNYQRLLERGFSGGNRNPLMRPAVSNTGNNWEKEGDKLPLQTFCGLASFIPERSAIQGNLPFGTNFTLGNGDRYYYKGKKTAGPWYNMGSQDIVPTYRWLVVEPGTLTVSTAITPNYTHLDAYTGGSCVELTGQATAAGTDIVLYKTNLNVRTADAYAKVAVKSGKEGVNPTNLYVILKKSTGEWVEIPVGNTEGKTWEEKKLNAGLQAGDIITRIGLRVKGNDDNYKLLVGKLEINDLSSATPAAVKDVTVDVKNEYKNSISTKIFWNVDMEAKDRADWGLLYNDEANIDHFEILYKNGETGRVSEIGRTSSWATYIGDIYFEGNDDKPFIGVRSVGTDLKTYSQIVWVEVPRNPAAPEREEEDSYGVSAMDPNCEGAAIARQQRYVTSITTTGATQNLNYSASGPVADGSQYADARDQILKVAQGQSVTMNVKCADFGDGLKWCFLGGWMDLNGSGNFDNTNDISEDPEGERLFFAGTIRAATPEFQSAAGVTFTFKIPEDATPGKSRLRIVFSDAWFAGMFLPTGLHAKGFTIDFGVEISGNNPGRGAVDTRDQGVADEPEKLEGGSIIDGIQTVEGGVSQAVLDGSNLNLQNVEKAWIYNAEGKFIQFVQGGAQTIDVAGYVPGTYVVKMQNGQIIRSTKFVVK
ncbi:MAG: GEVED domain-containing protein [Bacteroidales bacterium]|nr:GEVED domain-containing protein [Bacteroidales bacterium]